MFPKQVYVESRVLILISLLSSVSAETKKACMRQGQPSALVTTFDGITRFTGLQCTEFEILLERVLFAENFKLLDCIELVSNCKGDRRSIHNVGWTRNCIECGCVQRS